MGFLCTLGNAKLANAGVLAWHTWRFERLLRTRSVVVSFARGRKFGRNPVHILDDYYAFQFGHHPTVARNVCCVGVRVVWRISRVVSGIRADTVSDEQPHVGRRGLSEIERSRFRVIGQLAFHRSGATLTSSGTSVT